MNINNPPLLQNLSFLWPEGHWDIWKSSPIYCFHSFHHFGDTLLFFLCVHLLHFFFSWVLKKNNQHKMFPKRLAFITRYYKEILFLIAELGFLPWKINSFFQRQGTSAQQSTAISNTARPNHLCRHHLLY